MCDNKNVLNCLDACEKVSVGTHTYYDQFQDFLKMKIGKMKKKLKLKHLFQMVH
jgi:hypothetical protein